MDQHYHLQPTATVNKFNQHNNTNHPEKLNNTRTSSTQSEYGSSDDSSRRSPHAVDQQRPVADKEAFIQNDSSQKQWQHSMSPAQRAKELASEMKQNIEERRRSSVLSGDEKILKVGGNKEFRLD